jgi:hypothetical protein
MLTNHQRGNQNPYIEEEQTTQWPKEKVQKNKQRSTKHTYKTEDRVTRIPPHKKTRTPDKLQSPNLTTNINRINIETEIYFMEMGRN